MSCQAAEVEGDGLPVLEIYRTFREMQSPQQVRVQALSLYLSLYFRVVWMGLLTD